MRLLEGRFRRLVMDEITTDCFPPGRTKNGLGSDHNCFSPQMFELFVLTVFLSTFHSQLDTL